MVGGRSMDAETVTRAFGVMGRYLRERQVLGEIAVYGGSAILLQFNWRQTSEDVDAVIIDGRHESEVKQAVDHAAGVLGLPRDWLNNWVGMYTKLVEQPDDFKAVGTYPAGETPGLRVVVAKPEYLCAMKLKALERETLDDRDFEDAVGLASEIGIETAQDLRRLYDSFFPDEELSPIASTYLPQVAREIQRRRGG
jgi:hypothetical protein